MTSLITINKDITEIENNAILLQVVNCQGVMGVGLAKQFSTKYPDLLPRYQTYLKSWDYSCLGKVHQYCPSTSKPDFWIFNLFAQYGVGTDRRRLDYEALANCLEDITYFKEYNYIPDVPIYAPYGIGCDFAGGDWKIVKAMFEVYLPDIVICKLN